MPVSACVDTLLLVFYTLLMQKQVLMTIGVPFSGKSTLAKQYAAQGWEVIERDTILPQVLKSQKFLESLRSALIDQPEGTTEENLFKIKNQICIDLVSEAVQEKVLTSNQDRFFYDGTNLQKASRAGILALQGYGCRVSAIALPITPEELHNRMEATFASGERQGSFNETAFSDISRMLTMYEIPTYEEGFDELKMHEANQGEAIREVGLEYNFAPR
jgi:predicted kinase